MPRVFLLYALSGFVSLGYQVAWFRIYVDRFGSTNLTFALVVCNFIAGLGFGALASRRLTAGLERVTGVHDRLRLYGLVELLVTVTVLLTWVARWIPATAWGTFPYVLHGTIWEQSAAYEFSKLAIGTVCVFVPCFFMGVTFPLLCDAFRSDGRFPAKLYAWNTLGACLGVVASEFLFLPWIGHNAMLWVLVATNALLGAFFLATGGAPESDLAPAAPAAPAESEPAPGGELAGALAVLLTGALLSGLLSGALEADMFRRIAFIGPQYNAAMSFVSFWAIVGIFLASWAVRARPRMRLAHIKSAWVAGLVYNAVVWWFAYPIFFHVYTPGILPLFWFVGIFVFPSYLCVSLLLPWVCNRLQSARRHLGLAYGLNTLAFCTGMVGFTWAAPRVSIFYSLKLIFVLYAVLAALLLWIPEHRPLAWWKPAVAAAVLAIGCAFTPAGFDRGFVRPDLPSATRPVRAMKSDGAHTTYVVEAQGGDYLYFDNHPMSGTVGRAQVYMRLMAHFPLLAHPDPQRALLICFGVGNTASAIAAHPSIRHIDVVDLNEKVIETAPEFARYNRRVYEDPRVRFIHDDGRNFLHLTDERYDLITSEPPPPMDTGVYRLYSKEYYEDVLAHLTPGGLMSQWLPIYQMPRRAVDLAASTFLDVFPHCVLFTGYLEELILVGSREPIDLKRIEDRFASAPVALGDLRRYGMRRPVALFARLMQGDGMLREQFGGKGVISDARNDLAYLFWDASDPPVVRYDPLRLLREVGAERLDCYAELRREVTHLGRLTFQVPDFPPRSLETVRTEEPRKIALADLDWSLVTRGRTQAVLAMTSGRTEEAATDFRRILSLSPEQPAPLRELAQDLERAGHPDQAARAFTQVLGFEPDDVSANLGLARTRLALGQPGAALPPLRHVLQLEPDHSGAQALLAKAQGTDAPPR